MNGYVDKVKPLPAAFSAFFAYLLRTLKAMLHGAIFLATCNAILLLRDVN